jgi:hypothetical protein
LTRTLINLLLVFCLFLPAAFATSEQVLVVDLYYSSLTTKYASFGDYYQMIMTDTVFDTSAPAPISLTMKDLRVNLATAPGAGNSVTITVQKDGVDTDLSVTISDAATTAAVDTDTVSFSAGNNMRIKAVGVSGPSNSFAEVSVTIVASSSVILGRIPAYGVTSGTYYFPASGPYTSNVSVDNVSQPMPVAGTLKNLYVDKTHAPGAGKSYSYTIMKNEAVTSLGVTIADAATSASDTSNTVSIAAGDTIAMRQVRTNGPASSGAGWGIEFEPTTPGYSVFLGCSLGDMPSNAATEYCNFTNSIKSVGYFTSTEADRQTKINEIQLTDLYVVMDEPPGEGKSFDFTVRDDGADTGLTTSISGTATNNSVSASVTVAAGSDMSFKTEPTDSPTTSTIFWGIAGYDTPTGGGSSSSSSGGSVLFTIAD